MDTLSMIVSPSTILLQPLVGRFHAYDPGFCRYGQAMFGHQVGICHHLGAATVVVWHCMGV